MYKTNKTEKSYEGYGWIKVKRATPIEIDGNRYISEQHHVEETTFLIEEIRKLAKHVDDLTNALDDACDR